MAALNRPFPTLIDAAAPGGQTFASPLLRAVLLAVVGSVALWVSAKVQVPFYPVPQTLQTLVVLALGAAFGWRLAAATVVLYLLQGAAGLPVFAGAPEKGIGLAYMAGPTGGYLLGFVLGAATVGALAERGWDRSVATMAAAMTLGTIAIYVPGLAWMTVLFGYENALAWGLLPFMYGDVLKIALAAVFFPAVWALLGKR